MTSALHPLIIPIIRIRIQLLDLANQRITRIRARALVVKSLFRKIVKVGKELLLVHTGSLNRLRYLQYRIFLFRPFIRNHRKRNHRKGRNFAARAGIF